MDDLITQRFPIADAVGAYQLIESRAEPYLGIVLTYPGLDQAPDPIVVHGAKRSGDTLGVGLVGAGAFAASVLIPALRHAGFGRLVAVASSSGLSARRLADQAGFEHAVSGADAVIDDPDVDVVVIATPHDTHAEFAIRALRAGKHVWCEKPLALTEDELDQIEAAFKEAGSVLYVGFNRRMAPAVVDVAGRLAGGAGPLVIDYRVSAGAVADGHWYADRRQGGRLLGEVCHFVDTCAALAGPIIDASALGSIGQQELALAGSFVVSLRHADGSLSTIAYAANGHRGTEKERIEILGRGHTAVIADFRTVTFDGRTERLGGQDKGHQALAFAFHQAVQRGGPAEVGLERRGPSCGRRRHSAADCRRGVSVKARSVGRLRMVRPPQPATTPLQLVRLRDHPIVPAGGASTPWLSTRRASAMMRSGSRPTTVLVPSVHGDGTFGIVPQGQARHAEDGCLLLDRARVGEDQPGRRLERHEVQVTERRGQDETRRDVALDVEPGLGCAGAPERSAGTRRR